MGTKVCGDGFCEPFYRRGRRLTENDQLIEQIDGTKAIISSLFAPVFVLIEPQRSCLQLCALLDLAKIFYDIFMRQPLSKFEICWLSGVYIVYIG